MSNQGASIGLSSTSEAEAAQPTHSDRSSGDAWVEEAALLRISDLRFS